MKKHICVFAFSLLAGMCPVFAQMGGYGPGMDIRRSMDMSMRGRPQRSADIAVMTDIAKGMTEDLRERLSLDEKQAVKTEKAIYSQLRAEAATGVDLFAMPGAEFIRDDEDPQEAGPAEGDGKPVDMEPADMVELLDKRHQALAKKFGKIFTAQQLRGWEQLEVERMRSYFRKAK